MGVDSCTHHNAEAIAAVRKQLQENDNIPCKPRPINTTIPAVHPAPLAIPAEHDTWEVLPRQWELSDFKPIQKLYRGYASKVYLAEDNGKIVKRGPAGQEVTVHGNGKKVVLKVYDLLRLSPLTRYQLDREVRLHASVEHNNIIKLVAAFTQADFCILVQDYAEGGDLYNYLHRNRIKMNEKRLVRLVMAPCLAALAYLHTKDIVHRDIKPENLLLDADNDIKLADFGLSINLTEEHAVTRAGTLDYMAPEVLVCPLKRLPTDYKDAPDLPYTAKVDSWSVGVLAYELMTGHSPYQQRDETNLLHAITNTQLAFPTGMSPAARDWIQHALVKDPTKRASVAELLSHPWIAGHARQPASVFAPAEAGDGTSTPEGAARVALHRRMGPALLGEDKSRSSISPAVMGIRLQDDGHQGCRSPAALHIPTGGTTPNPFGTPHGSTGGPVMSPPSTLSPIAIAAAAGRVRAERESPLGSSMRRDSAQLSSLHPARSVDVGAGSMPDVSPPGSRSQLRHKDSTASN